MSAPLPDLHGYVGKSITDLCSNHYDTPSQSHCAHFVSHVLNIKLGTLCGDMAFKTRRTGASIRCNELFNLLNDRGRWEERQATVDGLLIFVTSAKNVVNNFMRDAPQKHVGIYYGGRVYNFSNGHHRVVVDPTVDEFHNKFKHVYRGGDISLFYGVAP